jgi:S-adenosylmethionine synthetase
MVPEEYRLARDLCRYIYDSHEYDGKTQVTIDSENNITHIVASFQNTPYEELDHRTYEWLENQGVNPHSITRYLNPAGDWEQGGFDADAGLTGRKLVVDNYGPRVPIGGGAYSGKDPSKVDRSAAYMARYIAVQELKFCNKVDSDDTEIYCQLSYAIGRKEPIQAVCWNQDGESWNVEDHYEVYPNDIIEFLDLKKPIYYETAHWGAYGNGFKWDKE